MKNFFKAMAVSATVAISAPAEAAPVDVDIMFVIDHSGSMSSAFTSLAADITAFVNGLAGSADVSSLATGVVTYEAARNGANTTCGSSAAQSCLAVKQGLTTNVGDVTAALNTAATQTFGGTEDALLAVDSVLPGGALFGTAGWRSNTVKSIVLITDEDADDERDGLYSYGGLTGYAALGQKLDDVNYLNNIITSSGLFNEYEPSSRPIGMPGDHEALFDLSAFLADPNAFLTQFAAAKLDEITTGGTPTGGSNVVPLPAAAWFLIAGIGGLGVMGRRKKAA